MTGHCQCWAAVVIHADHCCMRELPPGETVAPCGHQDEGMLIHRATVESFVQVVALPRVVTQA